MDDQSQIITTQKAKKNVLRIDTSRIEKANILENDGDLGSLLDLGVSAYNPEAVEESVISQVEKQMQEQEKKKDLLYCTIEILTKKADSIRELLEIKKFPEDSPLPVTLQKD
eukprot:c38713_g1_i1.p1 GENE.c38713_g1_i1~~c38713_g1_i1.p1  ORF type:complete len:123 (+),score=31.52 c38713_g1_i1:36-371(+)